MSAKVPIMITLSCGHPIWVRLSPMRNNARYACRLGTGCGYQLPWVKWEDTNTGIVRVNDGSRNGGVFKKKGEGS